MYFCLFEGCYQCLFHCCQVLKSDEGVGTICEYLALLAHYHFYTIQFITVQFEEDHSQPVTNKLYKITSGKQKLF